MGAPTDSQTQETRSMPPRIISLAEAQEYVNVLYYGEGGSGKSTDAAFLAKRGKVIYIDAESGVKARPLAKLGVPVDNIMRYHVENYKDMDDLYWSVKGMLDNDPESIYGVVFDSMTELQKKLMESITGERHTKRTAAGMVSDEFSADRDEYGKMTEQVRRISRRFRDLPCHVAFVCLAKREIDNDGAFYRPMLTPAFASDLVGYVDIVLYTEQQACDDPTDGSRFVGTCAPVDRARGKDRFGVLPTVFACPTMDRVIDYVNTPLDQNPLHQVGDDPFMVKYYQRTRPDEMVDQNTGELLSGDELREKVAKLAGFGS